jgi:acyl-CoA hydrolase
MEIKKYVSHRMVKGEDLNHHGTLFAGRTAQWFVEAGFIAAASLTHPKNTLCLKIHGMLFKKPVQNGNVIRFESRVVHSGVTSLTTFIQVFDSDTEGFLLEGFITFVHVDETERPTPHGLVIKPSEPEYIKLQERAKNLLKSSAKFPGPE